MRGPVARKIVMRLFFREIVQARVSSGRCERWEHPLTRAQIIEKRTFRCVPLVGVDPLMFDVEDPWKKGGIEGSETV